MSATDMSFGRRLRRRRQLPLFQAASDEEVALAHPFTVNSRPQKQDREGKPQTVPVITLLVSPEDAGRLAMASTQGKIQLALRNTVDNKKVGPAAVLEANLFSGGAPAPKHAGPVRVAAPHPTPASPYVIEVITGNKRENKSFPNQ